MSARRSPPDRGPSGHKAARMVRVDDAHLRVDDISHMKMDRGHSYTNLRITMRDGAEYVHRDWNGSAGAIESKILAAIEGQP